MCLLDANGALVPDGSSQSCVSPEPTLAQPCEVGQTGLCKSQTRNGVDSGRWTNAYQFDFCTQQLLYYTTSGSFSRTTCDAADATCRWYCAQHESTGAWSSRQRPSGRSETVNRNWWTCGWWSGYTWRNNQCQDTRRYLGEQCWDGGECQNDGALSHQRMACATVPAIGIDTATCIPNKFKLESERNQCECNWFDWHFGFACGSSQCNGHSCTLNTGDGNRYCDYGNDNNW